MDNKSISTEILEIEIGDFLAKGEQFLTITNKEEYLIANEYLIQNKAKQKEIEEKLSPNVKQAYSLYKNLLDEKNALNGSESKLVKDYKKISCACSAYLLEQEKLRQIEQKRLDEEARIQAEKAKAIIFAAAEKEEIAGDIQCASDLLEQAADIEPEKVELEKVISNTKLSSGATHWNSKLQISLSDPVKFCEAIVKNIFPKDSIEVDIKVMVLKRHFEKLGIKDYDENGIIVKEIKTPRVEAY